MEKLLVICFFQNARLDTNPPESTQTRSMTLKKRCVRSLDSRWREKQASGLIGANIADKKWRKGCRNNLLANGVGWTCRRTRREPRRTDTQANNLTRSNFGVEMRFPGLGRARLVSVLNLIKNDDNACGKKLLRFKWKRKIILLHKTV